MKLILEQWKSNKGNREDHYFIDSKGEKVYLWGYNPKLVGREKVRRIIKIINERNK